FLQAGDGIRCSHVTGVQTCALPISQGRRRGPGAGTPSGRGPAHAPGGRTGTGQVPAAPADGPGQADRAFGIDPRPGRDPADRGPDRKSVVEGTTEYVGEQRRASTTG